MDSKGKFWYAFLLLWNFKVLLISILISIGLSSIFTLLVYGYFGFPNLYFHGSSGVLFVGIILALFFSSMLFSSIIGIVLGFLFSFKSVFSQRVFGFRFRFKNSFFGCARGSEKDKVSEIEEITLHDVLPIWRKWLWKVVLQTAILTLIFVIIQKLFNIEINFYNYLLTILFIFLTGNYNLYVILKYDKDIQVCNF